MDACRCRGTGLSSAGTFVEHGIEYCDFCCRPIDVTATVGRVASKASVRTYVLRGFLVAIAVMVGVPALLVIVRAATWGLRGEYRLWISDEPARQACEAAQRWQDSSYCQSGLAAGICVRDVNYLVRAVAAAQHSEIPGLQEARSEDAFQVARPDAFRANLLVSHSAILDWCEGH